MMQEDEKTEIAPRRRPSPTPPGGRFLVVDLSGPALIAISDRIVAERREMDDRVDSLLSHPYGGHECLSVAPECGSRPAPRVQGLK